MCPVQSCFNDGWIRAELCMHALIYARMSLSSSESIRTVYDGNPSKALYVVGDAAADRHVNAPPKQKIARDELHARGG
jgi:hypothetical protein